MAQPGKHPLEPLSAIEIETVAHNVRKAYPNQELYFRVIMLSEPPKSETLKYLESSDPSLEPARRAHVQLYIGTRNPENLWELKVGLDSNQIVQRKLLKGRHPHVDASDMQRAEKACLADPTIQAATAELKLPAGADVLIEPWTYATDGVYDTSKKVTMCYFYAKYINHTEANHYAHPLNFYAVLSGDFQVLEVLRLPGTLPPLESEPTNKDATPANQEYHPDLVPTRTPPKPLQILQPQGPSFTITGHHITWQKWSLHIGFNYREGLTLHNITYDSQQLFYRLSLSEMFVPYGDPRPPYPRKAAFDLGNDGAGVNANNLRLGCDCLGHIAYFDGWHVTSDGTPLKLPNVVCCHEVDDGIGWKHTNFRTNMPVVTRARVLVLQTVVTVSNYEYIFAFHFGQDASIHYEVRATGIVSTVPHSGDENSPYGVTLAPGLMAPVHQHLFSLRIDPALGGDRNSLAVEEAHALPFTEGDGENPFGVGFTTKSTIVQHEGGLDLDINANRTFKIVNENIINPITKTPIGYKLIPHPSQLLLAHPSSYHAKRSEFAAHHVWVTRHHDEELFAAGEHTMQSRGGEGIASWIKSREGSESSNVRNQDIVVWHTFGSTHIPRIEDWPVMPAEKMTVGLKPVNFFSKNPSIDVPPSRPEENGSVLVNGSNGACH